MTKTTIKRQGEPSPSTDGTVATLAISVPLRPEPLSPWYRFGIIDNQRRQVGRSVADLRVLSDFCLHLQVEGRSWMWCEALEGSVAVAPGDVLFIPPGFMHAWAYVGESHLAIHFDLQRNPGLTPHNYDSSYNMIRHIDRNVTEEPRQTMLVFHLLFPGQDVTEAWRIPLVTRVPNPMEWQRRLGDLVRRWETRTLETVLSQLRANRTLGWALEELTIRAEHNVHLADDPKIAELLDRLRDPAVLAEVSRQPVTEIARRLGMGETQFRKRFRIMTSRTPHQYLRERQVQQAAGMLSETSLSVKRIAQIVGFEDPYHFSRLFRELTGQSPARFRRGRSAERTEKT